MRILVSWLAQFFLGSWLGLFSHLSPGKFNCLAGDKCQPIFPRGTIVWSDDKWWPDQNAAARCGTKTMGFSPWKKHQNRHVFKGNLEKQHQLLCGTLFWDKPNLETKKSAWSVDRQVIGERCFRSCTKYMALCLTRWTELHVRDVRCRGNFASDYYLTWSISKSSRLSRPGTWPFRLLLDYLTPQKFTLTKQVSSNGVPPNHPFSYDFPL